MQAIRHRLTRLERNLPTKESRYQLAVTILLEDDATDDEINQHQTQKPNYRFIRFSDFANECC